MKYIIPMISFAAFAAAMLSGCQSLSVDDNWPYHGPPMVGTNTIPAPKW